MKEEKVTMFNVAFKKLISRGVIIKPYISTTKVFVSINLP
jgi:hypothetical protein